MPELIATFRGLVSCRREPGVPGFTLVGDTAERPGERTALTFSAAAPADLPDTLEDATVERLGAGQYHIVSAASSWAIAARTVELHREVAEPFYRALPPRRVPRMKRVFWRVVLALAASRAGVAALRALRR